MTPEQQMVRTFMTEVKGLALPGVPTVPNQDMANLCHALILEESTETMNALVFSDRDLVEIADGLADLLYVTLYAANACGLDLEPIFAEVHRSNLTKKGGEKRADGKALKPPWYEPPNLGPILRAQGEALA